MSYTDEPATARRLLAGMTALVVTDAAGGLLAVSADVNTWTGAWGSRALLAAPLPMIAAQVVLAWLAARGSRRVGTVAASVLGVACLVSVASGFFDGGLGHRDLTAPLVAFQAGLLAVTGIVGLLAGLRARDLMKQTRPRTVRAAVGAAGRAGRG